MRAWLSAFLLTVFLMCPAVGHAGDVEITHAVFGIFNPPAAGAPGFVPTTTVPLVPGQTYGWIMTLKTTKSSVHWREEFTLPAAAPWNGPVDPQASTSVSADKTTSVTEMDQPIGQVPIIFHGWSVAQGDPKGHYKIRVIVDGTLEQVFEFDVQ